MAKLTGPADKILFLRPVAYSFRDASDAWDRWDDWLIVDLVVVDGARRWAANRPMFLTWELPFLIQWFRQLADAAPDARDNLNFLEPKLRFTAAGRADDTRVTAYFWHRFHPDWRAWRESGRRFDLHPVSVEFSPGVAALHRFADELEQELKPFPERATERE